ncbi:hypothetical protein DY000_02001151 [Brassica cretica]|uniref:Secreted protein n=1 Tax=Brassica cretica TaxID=69181 RepID=A0ABQ7CER6_BRACR|nr:hypothetical protein DY000_02001151 [Brassica cretica]
MRSRRPDSRRGSARRLFTVVFTLARRMQTVRVTCFRTWSVTNRCKWISRMDFLHYYYLPEFPEASASMVEKITMDNNNNRRLKEASCVGSRVGPDENN